MQRGLHKARLLISFYLEGRFFWNKQTSAAIKQRIDYFNQAIEIDSNYALAYPAWLTHGDKVWRDPVTHAGENAGDAEASSADWLF